MFMLVGWAEVRPRRQNAGGGVKRFNNSGVVWNPQAQRLGRAASVARASIERVRANTGRHPRRWPLRSGLWPMPLVVRSAQQHRGIPEQCRCLVVLPSR
jgi:hypothetical protein